MVRRHPHPVSSNNRPTLDLQYPVSDAVPYACNRIGVSGGSNVDDAGGAVVGSGGASTTASTVPTLPSTISTSTVVQPRIIR